VGEQRTAAGEISDSIHRAAGATEEVSRAIAGVTEGTRETSDAAGQVETAALELSKLSETLKLEVDRFLRQVRQG
jgi:methyl-accepting chemotaxis protein